jgi:energy-coupling factor transporter ATP-binding protein EcfA2
MRPAVEVRNLRFEYSDGVPALNGVSFSVDPGECVGLIGPNGAGKSTLLLHLNGLLPHDREHAHEARDHPQIHDHRHRHAHDHADAAHGSVVVEGIPVVPENFFAVRRKVGLLFQDPNDQLFCPTVFEDVAFGPQQFGGSDAEVRARVTQALALAGVAGFEDRAPHHLSIGEKRRVCLAGVLACDPSILVLDEPSSSLDPKGRRELIDLLRRIPMTKLIATHDLEFVVELCSRVILLERGSIVAEGPTVGLLSNEELMLRHHLERPHILAHRHPH